MMMYLQTHVGIPRGEVSQ